MEKQWKQSQTLFGGAPKITADGDCSHAIKRLLLLGRKAMTSLLFILQARRLEWLGYLPAGDVDRHFPKEDIQMANRPHEKMLNITNKKECKSKPHWGITSHQSEWLLFKSLQIDKHWRRGGEKRTLLHCWWECKLMHLRQKTLRRIL